MLVLTASESPGKTKSESQKVSLSSLNEQQPRTGRLVMGASSSNFSEWNIDDKWSSQEWKSDEMLGARTERPLGGQESTLEIEKDILFGHEDIKHSTRTVRPVGGQESTLVEELGIDFRVPGLSHAVVKEAEHFRVQELVKKIESHPHREALQADLQQNNVYNSLSNNSKAMIRELGNVELFELCETIPKVQCSHCLLYWSQGIVYCTCGQFLVESESRRKFNRLRLDALSIPHYVIKKGRGHGARYVKTEEQKEYHIAWNAWKRCCKKVDSQGELFTGIHDKFPRDQVYRESQLAIGWTD